MLIWISVGQSAVKSTCQWSFLWQCIQQSIDLITSLLQSFLIFFSYWYSSRNNHLSHCTAPGTGESFQVLLQHRKRYTERKISLFKRRCVQERWGGGRDRGKARFVGCPAAAWWLSHGRQCMTYSGRGWMIVHIFGGYQHARIMKVSQMRMRDCKASVCCLKTHIFSLSAFIEHLNNIVLLWLRNYRHPAHTQSLTFPITSFPLSFLTEKKWKKKTTQLSTWHIIYPCSQMWFHLQLPEHDYNSYRGAGWEAVLHKLPKLMVSSVNQLLKWISVTIICAVSLCKQRTRKEKVTFIVTTETYSRIRLTNVTLKRSGRARFTET